MTQAIRASRRTRRYCRPPKPKIGLVLSLHEPLKRGEKTALREHFNIRSAEFATLLPERGGPWSPGVTRLPWPYHDDILILAEWGSSDSYKVFEVIASMRDEYRYALGRGVLIEPTDQQDRCAHRLIRGGDRVS